MESSCKRKEARIKSTINFQCNPNKSKTILFQIRIDSVRQSTSYTSITIHFKIIPLLIHLSPFQFLSYRPSFSQYKQMTSRFHNRFQSIFSSPRLLMSIGGRWRRRPLFPFLILIPLNQPNMLFII